VPGSLVTRRLSAIVVADVAGYSRLMERDEGGTHAQLKRLRERVVDPEIGRRGGRLVKTTGDGFLAEFGTAGAALRFAIGVQRAMASHNRDVEAAARIEFRIGINVGDIIVDDDDVAGDGVNVASRLEALAEPGGICVTAAVRDQVHDDLDARFVDAGEQRVKNIERPIRVYRVLLGGEGMRQPRRLLPAFAQRRWIAAMVLGVAVAAAGVVWLVTKSGREPIGGAPAMSVAIMPIAAAGDAAVEQLADALTRDLESGLARGSQAVVVAAHGAAARYRGNATDARALGRELNVRYLVEGQVRRTETRTVVSVQLIDAAKAAQVWSDRVELAGADATSDDTLLGRRLTSKVRAALFNAEYRRWSAEGGQGAGARDLVWRALSLDDGTLGAMRESGKLLDEALGLEPRLVPALANRALLLVFESELDPRADVAGLIGRADELSGRAVAVDGDDAYAWMVRSVVLGFAGRFDQALAASDLAQRLDPTRKSPMVWGAWLLLVTGEPDKALEVLDTARAAFPEETPREVVVACWANVALGRNALAIPLCEKAASMDNSHLAFMLLAAASANSGDRAKAATARADLEKRVPGYSIERLRAKRYSSDPRYVELAEKHLYPGLRSAGVPDH
jgi:class 3 adenylate cyclase/TolB-like protein